MMHTTNLRKVGGSVMLAIPPALLDILNLKVGASIGIVVDGASLVIKAAGRPRYTMDELLAASNYVDRPSDEDRDWLDGPVVGRELL
jgi:antitoxin ChpS